MSHSSWVVHSDKALEQLIQEKVLKRIMIPSFENNKCLRQETASRRFFQKDPQLQEFWDPPSLEHPLVVVPKPAVLLVVANSFQNLLHRRSFFQSCYFRRPGIASRTFHGIKLLFQFGKGTFSLIESLQKIHSISLLLGSEILI